MEEGIFKNKRILFLSISLFGYQIEIKNAMERMGAVVDYFDERPANTFLVKALIRMNRNWISSYIEKYHRRIIEQTRFNCYDFVFVIKGESIFADTVKSLRSVHPEAKFVIYHWDSIANNKNGIDTLGLFDEVFSFDKDDCDKFKLKFLPLFYLDDYQKIAQSTQIRDIDLLFIGTAHSDRYKLVSALADSFIAKKMKCFLYVYFPSPILYYKMKLINKSLIGTHRRDFQYKSLSKEEILELYKRSKFVIDIQHPKQVGLTMRSIEVLGSKRKLITTNQNIKSYDFYNENNVCIIDRENPIVKEAFLNTPYQDIPQEVYEKYQLQVWIQTILQ